MSTSLIIQTEDHITGSAQQMTITDINPNATNANLKTFAQMTAGLSKDTYVKAARVDKVELDDAKPAPAYSYFQVGGTNRDIVDGVVNVSLTPSQLPSNNFKIVVRGGVVYRMNRLPEWSSESSDMTAFDVLTHAASGAADRLTCSITLKNAPQVGQTYSGIFLIPESEFYAELSVTINITVAEEG